MSVLVRNIFSSWAGVVVNLVIAFFLSPFLVHRLGDSHYGLWVLVLSATGYLGLLDSGLRVSIVKHTAEYNARRDTEGLNRLLSTTLSMYGSLSIVVVLLALLGSTWFEHFFKIPSSEIPIGRILVVIAGINVALTLPMSVFGGLLSGLQRYDLLNQANITVVVARTIAIVAAVSTGFGLLTLGIIHLVGQLLNGIMLLRLSRQEFPSIELRPRTPEWIHVRTLYAYSGYIILNNVAMFLLFSSGEVLIGMFVGIAAVTPYALAHSLVAYLSSFIGAMTQVFHPYASDQHERGNADAVGRAVLIGTRTSLLIALPVGVSYLIVGSEFVGIWVGPEYGRASSTLLAALTVPQILWLSQSAAGNVLMGVGRHRVVTFLNLAAGICGIVIGWLLVQRLGSFGVALGAGLPILVWTLILSLYTTRSLRLPFHSYAMGAYFVPLAAVLPYAATLLVVSRLWPTTKLWLLAVQVTLCLATYVPFAFMIAFDRTRRSQLITRYFTGARLANEPR